tara:strand:+ start:4593 stop:5096 length:504 start_codon:yes stop_codon:yes gene_type:complete
VKKYNTTVKEVLTQKPKGVFVYRIMYDDTIPFYVGMSLKDLQARFKTHIAKFSGYKKYPNRPKCMEMVFEHTDLNFKCIGRQVHGFKQIRNIFNKNKIKFDFLNANVVLEQHYTEALSEHGTELSKNKTWPLTNKFVIEQIEDKILQKEVPLANDETIHLAEKRLGL